MPRSPEQSSSFKNPEFLKKFPGLGNAKEVMDAKKRTEKRTGERVSGDFASLIQNYLDSISEFRDKISETKNDRARERATGRFKSLIMDKFITKYENIPAAYWREKDENGDMGSFYRELYEHGLSGDWANMDEEEKEKYKKNHAETLIEDQRGSLEEWVDYFMNYELSGDIPDYLKYWIFRSLTGLQEYEKPKDWDKAKPSPRNQEEQPAQPDEEKKTLGQFPRRAKNSLKKYPDLNPEALRYVVDAIVGKHQDRTHEFEPDISEEEQERFKQYLDQENFAKLYAWAMESFNPIPEELLPITEGKWVKYKKGSNPNEVSKTLKGKGTGLCIAGKGAASQYLREGDLYIYYSNDQDGKPTFPRIAIHSQDNQIAEMRGIAKKQNLDPFMSEIATAKAAEFANGKEYEKKAADMKHLTEIENKTRNNEELTRDDLMFLYEIDSFIGYFGMREDPRIQELKDKRDKDADVLIIFECSKEQIAHSKEEINENTKAYIGPWNIETYRIIKSFPDIKHLYESFPDKKIFMQSLETDPAINSPIKAEEALRAKNIFISYWGSDILFKTEFSQEGRVYDLVEFTVGQLGLSDDATTEQIYARAQELGLELCPVEVGPYLCLQHPGKDWNLIAMNQITDRHGYSSVFSLHSDGARPVLLGNRALPDGRWGPDDQLVFASRQVEDKTAA